MNDGLRAGRCPVCGGNLPEETPYADGCDACTEKYPAALLKAHRDSFDYALRLRTGEVVRFESAHINGEWAHLTLLPDDMQLAIDGLPYLMERGVDVRIADIVWVADAPEGS